jgi:hypothetical protein
MRWRNEESIWKLRVDLASAKVLIWLACFARDRELNPAAHLYLASLYDRLSHAHRIRNHHAEAKRLAALAAAHYRDGGWDGPPFAAAKAMPRPRKWLRVDAISKSRLRGKAGSRGRFLRSRERSPRHV